MNGSSNNLQIMKSATVSAATAAPATPPPAATPNAAPAPAPGAPPISGAPETPAPAAATPPPETPKPPAIDPDREARYRARERQLQTDRAALRREQEQWQQQQQQRAPIEQQLSQDPIGTLARVWGVDRAVAEQHLGGRILNKGQATPSEEVAQLRHQVQQLQQSLQERDRRDQDAARQQKLNQELDNFVELARGSKDTHPWTADATQADAKRVRAACLRIAREDPSLTDAEILDRIEEEYAFTGKLRRADTTSTPATSPPGTDTVTPPAPTLTNHTASQRPSAGTSTRSILRMSPAERMQAGIEAVREARAKAAAKG